MEPIINIPEKKVIHLPEYIKSIGGMTAKENEYKILKAGTRYDPYFGVVIPKYIDVSKPFLLVIENGPILYGNNTFLYKHIPYKVIKVEDN